MEMEGDDKKLPSVLWRANPEGCKSCDAGDMGYRPVCEVLPSKRGVRDAASELMAGGGGRAAREAMAQGRTLTLIESALRLLKAGEVDLTSIIHL